MKKILFLLLLLVISFPVYSAEYDLVELFAYNTDPILRPGDLLYMKDAIDYWNDNRLREQFYNFPSMKFIFIGPKDMEEYGYINGNKHNYVNFYELDWDDFQFVIPNYGSECTYKIRMQEGISNEQFYLYSEDDSCYSYESFECFFDCGKNKYRCEYNLYNIPQGLINFYTEDWLQLKLIGVEQGPGQSNKIYSDIGIISSVESLRGTNIIIENNKIWPPESRCYENYSCPGFEKINGPNFIIRIDNTNLNSISDFENTEKLFSFEIDATKITGDLTVNLETLLLDYSITLPASPPECEVEESTVKITSSGEVLGVKDNIKNPKTGLKNYIIYSIPIIILVIINIYIKYKDKLFRKI